MGKKLTNLNQYISVIIGIAKKWFVIFELTIKQLSLGYVCLPQLEHNFSCLASSFFFFFFLLALSTFKPLNALYSNFERSKISERTFVRQKLGMQGWGDPLNQVLQSLEFLNR